MIEIILGVAFLAIALLGLLYFILTYNRFITLKNGIENSFNQIKVAMKKRMDMIQQLVDATKSYAKFEKSTLAEVTALRKMNIDSPAEVANAGAVSGALLGKLLAVVENYPDLKTIQGVVKLQNEIANVETEIARLRYLYNDQVQTFNTMVDVFPSNIIAGIMKFIKFEYLKFGEDVEKAPKVEF